MKYLFILFLAGCASTQTRPVDRLDNCQDDPAYYMTTQGEYRHMVKCLPQR